MCPEEEENNAQQPPVKPQRLASRQFAVIREGHFEIEGAAVVYAGSLDEAIATANEMQDKDGHGWRIYAPLDAEDDRA